ncbi:hypothetical protein QTG54_003854 [Skeletonema marinoi]|uniref:Uncharacterized protein n=1 Tax=Skeletonema marinoi TaxID=267567 RepID=A0AAD8YI65_9STRA|nr:hypothetical protein QTG54_003854 [Skeletonema marinoi]
MPKLGIGSPNASIYPKTKMRPEPVSYTKYFEDEDDDVSSTAAVNEADDDANEEKKRSATEDDNPGATKKSKADGEGEQIPAALPGLPDLVLSMKQDGNYLRIMNEAFKTMDGSEYNATVEKEMAREILQKLQRDYHLLDTNGDSADDNVALQKIRMCLRNKYTYKPRKPRQQSQPSRLPNIILDMTKDEHFERIMKEAFKELDGEEYDGTVEEMGDRVLQALKEKYHLVDRNGEPIDDEAALQKLVQCLKNQHYKSRRSDQSSNVTAPPSVATTATLDSLIAGSDVILDMRKDKTYRETMNKFFNDYVNKEYNDIAETGKAILLELQRSLGTEGRFRKGAGNRDAVESETALQMILQSLAKKSQNPTLGNSAYALPRNPSRTQDNSGAQSVQTPSRDNLTETERVCLLEYFGRSIVVNFLKKSDSCGWKFHFKAGLTEEWIAVKDGFTKNNAQEGVTMLTGLRKIANWAFREGHFEAYANDEFGRNMLERRGLSTETYKIIFDRESEAEERSGAISRRTISPNNSSPREDEDEGSDTTFQLRGKERDEYAKVYRDIALKLASASDRNGKEFFGLFAAGKLENKDDQYPASFEDVVEDAAAINDSWFRDTIIPSIIEEAKEKLLGA